MADINEAQAQETVKEIKVKGWLAASLVGDVSNQQEVTELFGALSRIDILVNSAGVSHIGTAESTLEADFDRLYNVNVKGVYNCLHVAIPMMKKNKGGVILNICSIAATMGFRTDLLIR